MAGKRKAGNENDLKLSDDPLVLIMRDKAMNRISTYVYKNEIGYEGFGLVVTDLVRHIAAAYGVPEDDVWYWVDAERVHHTTEIAELKPN